MTYFKQLFGLRVALSPSMILGVCAALLMLSLMTATARAETAWVGDLPVPADSLIDQNSAVNFDAPSGRVIRFTFQTGQDKVAIDVFYETRLTALGWQQTANGYVRGSEELQIISHGKSEGESYLYHVTLGPAD